MNESRRCTAHSSQTGERCKRSAIKGGTVCASHGGRAPQVKKSAKERLAELIEPALAGLHKALQSNDLTSIVKASQIVLDRTGFHPTKAVEMSGKDGGPIEANVQPFPVDKLSTPLKRALIAELDAIQQGANFGGRESPFMTLKKEALDKWNHQRPPLS